MRYPGVDVGWARLVIRISMPPCGARASWTSSMKLRMRKMPRPLDLSRFSGARGSGRSSGSRPDAAMLGFRSMTQPGEFAPDSLHRTDEGQWVSLRGEAQRLIGQAPPRELADYRRQFDGLARQPG